MTTHTESTETSGASIGANVYENNVFIHTDIGAQMRLGHVDVAEGDVYIVQLVERLLSRGATSRATIVDIGSGSGALSEMLAKRLPEHRVIANDTARANAERARRKLAPYANASVLESPFETWNEPTDIFISWGTHHHLAHGYLSQIHRLLKPGGRLIVGDEFCPEYLTAEELQNGRAWLVNGYLFTSEAEERQYKERGELPVSVARREEARRRALWTWYRYVIDQAIRRGDWTVALLELQIARDDLTTEFVDEHKTSPLLLETELRDGGFEVLSKHHIGNRRPELQSFVVYEAVARRAT